MSNNRDQHNRFAWLIVLLLFAGSVLNYMDRSLVGVIMPQVRRDLSLTNADFGLAINAFLIMYAVFYVLGGRIADRLGSRASFALTVAFWSLACMAHALVQGLRSLALCRALLGMGEGGFYPAAMRGAAEWFPPRDRAKAVGLILSALSVGTLLTPPLVAWLTLHYGWRASFLAIGGLGLLLLPPWLLLHRRIHRIYGARSPMPSESVEGESGAPGQDDPSLSEVLKTRKYWCVLGARASTDAAWYFFLFWIPGYFQDVRRFDLASVGRLLWIPFFSAGAGALAGAWASSALIRRGLGLHRSRKTILLASASLAFIGASAYFAPTAYWAIALVSLALFGHQSWGANIHTVITEITPPKHVAILYGITGAAGTLLGAASQLAIGRSVDLFGYGPAFVWAGLMPLLAVMFLQAAGTIERIRRKAVRLALP
jgi:ACS family hexuronate transporter-like MFS transporter